MTVNWKEVADALAMALSRVTAADTSLAPSALLAYRLACECERTVDPAETLQQRDQRLESERRSRAAFNGLTAEPRAGDRVRVVAVEDDRYRNGDEGVITHWSGNEAMVKFPHDNHAPLVFRREFEILPRDLNPPAVNTGD